MDNSPKKTSKVWKYFHYDIEDNKSFVEEKMSSFTNALAIAGLLNFLGSFENVE